jgi:hypothetical protein
VQVSAHVKVVQTRARFYDQHELAEMDAQGLCRYVYLYGYVLLSLSLSLSLSRSLALSLALSLSFDLFFYLLFLLSSISVMP